MTKSTTRRVILVDLSDTHAGSKLALMSPEARLHDEDENGNLTDYVPEQTASQRHLWNTYLENINFTKDYAGKDEILVIHNGDLTQGMKYPRALVSTRISDQVAIAVENLSPWLELPNVKHLRITVGTGAHNLTEGATELLAAQVLKERFPKKSIEVLYHGLLFVNDVPIDYAHHGPYPGSRAWLRGNVARYYLKSLMMEAAMSGAPIPKLVMRAHYHTPLQVSENITVHGEFVESTLLISPSFSMLDDHAHQATRSADTITNGIYLAELLPRTISRIIPLFKTVDIRTQETL